MLLFLHKINLSAVVPKKFKETLHANMLRARTPSMAHARSGMDPRRMSNKHKIGCIDVDEI